MLDVDIVINEDIFMNQFDVHRERVKKSKLKIWYLEPICEWIIYMYYLFSENWEQTNQIFIPAPENFLRFITLKFNKIILLFKFSKFLIV